VIPRLPVLYDEPFSDSSQIPTFLISQLARREVSVILTGDGGDELFCGYGRYDEARFTGPTKEQRIESYRTYLSKWQSPEEIVIVGREPENLVSQPDRWLRRGEFCDQMMHLDTIAYLPDDLLVKVDRAAMAVGLETRTPFLDHRLIAFAWSLPFRMKVNEGRRKWILRQVLYRDVPPALVDRPKQGFEIPLATWLLGPLRGWAESLLDENRLTNEGFLNPRPIRKRWEEFLAGNHKVRHAIWAILMFQAWLEHAQEAK
jgi:asparagine synthase (glutamine-hydrolysing)